jgi:predicted ester cyclase
MSFKENSRSMRRWIETVDSGNEADAFALIDQLFTVDYVLHTGGSVFSGPVDVKGYDGLREHVRIANRTFGNMQHIVEDEFGDDYRLATRIRFRAIPKGILPGIAGADRPIECTIIYIQHFKEGKIQECWTVYPDDLTALMKE